MALGGSTVAVAVGCGVTAVVGVTVMVGTSEGAALMITIELTEAPDAGVEVHAAGLMNSMMNRMRSWVRLFIGPQCTRKLLLTI